MTFEAYISNIRAKTGKAPKDFFEEAVQKGVLHADTKTMEFVAWLKANSGLGHGHAMAVWEAFRRNGWVPMSGAPAVAAKSGGKR
ncbi:MAG TPA: DUF4287 domain-containing protein [Burkholderiaceae bacterium]|nr:DUF4287 domain-containing protein [Burkholderiaceae bacterium]